MLKLIRILALVFLAYVLLSCGGSGGGGNPAGLTYTTVWRDRLTPGQITGVSQRVSLLDSTGTAVSTIILQNTTLAQESFTFNVSNGTYRLVAELFSLSSASGTRTGIFQVPVTISGGSASPITSYVGNAVNGISVVPADANVQVGRGQVFYAFGTNAGGSPTFIDAAQLTWSVLGPIGTVTADGFFSASAVGTGSVRALYGPTSRSGSAAVTTTPNSASRSKWTVLVYMNAANDLQTFSNLNMNQMERVASNPDLRFVVQWKQFPAAFSGGLFNGTRRYLVKQDSSSNIGSELLQDMGTGVDMGSTTTLREFIQWGKANFPADRYCLIVWNHGNGWKRSRSFDVTRAVSYDDERGTSIQIWDLNQALGSEQFDIIAWDASLMQMIECAYEVKDNARFVVGSEESPPGEGYPYDTIFAPLRDNPDLATRQFTKSFVDGMLGVPAYATRKITQSVLDTTQLQNYANAIGGLGSALKNAQPGVNGAITTARNTSQGYSVLANRVYLDVIDVCDKLQANTTDANVLNAIAAVRTAHGNAVVWEGHNSNSPRSNGVSIDFSSGTVISGSLTDYQRLKLAINTMWDEYLTTAP